MAKIRGVSLVHRDINLLHPWIRDAAWGLCKALEDARLAGVIKDNLQPFETYRDPIRQDWLRTNQPRSTGAKAYYSAHQYGMAIDFCGWTDKGEPTWEVETASWEQLHKIAGQFGFEAPVPWDLGHIVDPRWTALKP